MRPASRAAGGFAVTSASRVLFPELGLTKQALADYYALMAEHMLPHLAGRPLSLVRCPAGRAKTCFFQKHDNGAFPDSVRRVAIVESSGKTADYLHVEDSMGLLACVQMGTIEFHGWGACVGDLERPDRLVFDLDPGEGVGFAAVRAAAGLIRDRLAAHGLDAWPMLSGGKGVHVVAPLVPRAEWPAVTAFARGLAEGIANEAPDAFTATMSKAKRKGRIFIDWLRNQRGETSVAPWSVRARAGAGVAAPVAWEQLADIAAANVLTAADPAQVEAQAERARPVAAPRPLPGWG
jgi:bifunctional non-homologous end joining protein LigD